MSVEDLVNAARNVRIRLAVDAIVEDLSDRRGLKHEWRQIEPAIQREIRRTWESLIRETLYGKPAAPKEARPHADE
jgi:hypothetical protein